MTLIRTGNRAWVLIATVMVLMMSIPGLVFFMAVYQNVRMF